jgi:fluoroacetyl-CoA thioesterase
LPNSGAAVPEQAYRAAVPVEPGLSASAELVVTDTDTAIACGSGDVPVLGTPRLLALAEEATVRAVASALDPGATTVGFQVQLDHSAATGVGGTVRAEATLEQVDGRRLIFRVTVYDGHGLVAAGRITRVVVDRDRFLASLDGPARA